MVYVVICFVMVAIYSHGEVVFPLVLGLLCPTRRVTPKLKSAFSFDRNAICTSPTVLDLNGRERYEYLQEKAKEYLMLRSSWKDNFSRGIASEELKFITSMVRKDVIRTDRTHSFFRGRDDNKNTESLFDLLCTYSLHHPDVSYCQGMSDLASVMLVVQADESNAYICFCALMKRLKANFLFDGKAMTKKFDHLKLLLLYHDPELWHYMMANDTQDLFFTYRWLLLELKREFAFNDALYMLETMWSTLPIESSPVGVPLSDTHCLSTDGSVLFAKQPARVAPIHHSGSCGTPTPYTKLLSLCRKGSNHSITPLATDAVSQMLNGCAAGSKSESPRRLSDIASRSSTDMEGSPNSEEPEPSIQCLEPTSTFYIGVGEDINGILQYTDEGLDNCSEALESGNSSCSNLHYSSGSLDSGIKTQLPVPLALSSRGSDLQFTLESSDSHHPHPHPSVLPPPEEFGSGNAFLMFAAFTMIEQHRDHIIKNRLDFESIAMLFDRRVRRNDVNKVICNTKIAYENYLKECHAYA